jgi:hypothetical protein
LLKRSSSRFHAAHQSGYLRRNSSISAGGANSRPPAASAFEACSLSIAPPLKKAPETRASTIPIGITVKARSSVVSRLSGRSG